MSTVLFKNNRIRAKWKTRLQNLIRHLIRNYKPETRQAKEDFNYDEIHNNLIIDGDFNISKFGPDWLDGKVADEKDLLNSLIENVIAKSNDNIQSEIEKADGLTVAEKKAIRKSINYYATLNLDAMSDKEREALQPLIDECKTIKEQDKSNKNYNISEQATDRAQLFFDELTKETKVKSLNAKKNNLTKIKSNISGMQTNTNEIKNSELKPNSILVEERLFKIPKHNGKGLPPEVMTEIMQSWHNKYFSDYDALRGYIHLDERTSAGNEVDDHIHFLISGYNNKTKKFDISEHTYRVGLEIAQRNNIKVDRAGIDIDIEEALKKPYNKATEKERTFAGEILQNAFYVHANKIVKKNGIDIKFERKKLTPEEMELRSFIASQSKLPKSKRISNMANYMEEKAKEKAREMLEKEKELRNDKAIKNRVVNNMIKENREELSSNVVNHILKNEKNKAYFKDKATEKIIDTEGKEILIKHLEELDQKLEGLNKIETLQNESKEFYKIQDVAFDFADTIKKSPYIFGLVGYYKNAKKSVLSFSMTDDQKRSINKIFDAFENAALKVGEIFKITHLFSEKDELGNDYRAEQEKKPEPKPDYSKKSVQKLENLVNQRTEQGIQTIERIENNEEQLKKSRRRKGPGR